MRAAFLHRVFRLFVISSTDSASLVAFAWFSAMVRVITSLLGVCRRAWSWPLRLPRQCMFSMSRDDSRLGAETPVTFTATVRLGRCKAPIRSRLVWSERGLDYDGSINAQRTLAIASLFHAARPWRGVGEPGHWPHDSRRSN